jgi:hypothetical protein
MRRKNFIIRIKHDSTIDDSRQFQGVFLEITRFRQGAEPLGLD